MRITVLILAVSSDTCSFGDTAHLPDVYAAFRHVLADHVLFDIEHPGVDVTVTLELPVIEDTEHQVKEQGQQY